MPAPESSRSSLLALARPLPLLAAAFVFSALPLAAQERQEPPHRYLGPGY